MTATNASANTPSYPLASLIKRLAAFVYDTLIYTSVAFAYVGIILAIKYGALNIELEDNGRTSIGVIGFAGLLLTLWSFTAFFWLKKGGQTLGMKTWRLRLVQADGKNLNNSSVIKRLAFGNLTLATLGLGYLWALIDPEKASLHDRLSGTRVIQLPKDKKT